MKTIRLPSRFLDDHYDRGLPTPKDIGNSQTYALVRSDDPAICELLDDAEHYAVMTNRGGRSDCMPQGLVASAASTVRAIRNVIGWDDASPAITELRK